MRVLFVRVRVLLRHVPNRVRIRGRRAPAMHDRRVGKPFCNDWHDRAIRPISCTGRDDRRELVDLRDRDERLHVVDELRGALGLHTIRESGLATKSTAALLAVSRSYVMFAG